MLGCSLCCKGTFEFFDPTASGTAQFMTIYPGWYPGRTVHIHFKIRTDIAAERAFEFTSQLYFDEAITDAVHAQPPYASREQRPLKNDRDYIFRGVVTN